MQLYATKGIMKHKNGDKPMIFMSAVYRLKNQEDGIGKIIIIRTDLPKTDPNNYVVYDLPGSSYNDIYKKALQIQEEFNLNRFNKDMVSTSNTIEINAQDAPETQNEVMLTAESAFSHLYKMISKRYMVEIIEKALSQTPADQNDTTPTVMSFGASKDFERAVLVDGRISSQDDIEKIFTEQKAQSKSQPASASDSVVPEDYFDNLLKSHKPEILCEIVKKITPEKLIQKYGEKQTKKFLEAILYR